MWAAHLKISYISNSQLQNCIMRIYEKRAFVFPPFIIHSFLRYICPLDNMAIMELPLHKAPFASYSTADTHYIRKSH